jgi:hypothetical protein
LVALFFLWLLVPKNFYNNKKTPGSILFLGHAYDSDELVDKRIEDMDLSQYENI